MRGFRSAREDAEMEDGGDIVGIMSKHRPMMIRQGVTTKNMLDSFGMHTRWKLLVL